MVRHPRCVFCKPDWRISTVLHKYLVDIYIYIYIYVYIIYYIDNNYMFRHFSLAIFR